METFVILSVDDNKDVQRVVRKQLDLLQNELAHVKIEILQVTNIEAAKSILSAKNNIGLMLLDFQMPGGTGAQLLANLEAASVKIPFVALLSSAKDEFVNVLGDVPEYVVASIQKPIGKEELWKVMVKVLTHLGYDLNAA